MNRLIRQVMDYYCSYTPILHDDILHTIEVATYTRLIAEGEGATPSEVEQLCMAAWLHDIGCPQSVEIYGNSLPANQQLVGREVAAQLLDERDDIAMSVKEWLVEVVGTHHQHIQAIELGFMPLFEADLIVNILSGYYSLDKAPHLYNTLMQTESGKQLFHRLIK